MHETLEMLVPVLGRALLDFLWQGALIGVIAALLLQAARNARPQLRYAIACLALLACAATPVADVARQLAAAGSENPTPAVAAPAMAFVPAISQAPASVAEWRIDDALPWIVALWAIGACFLSLRMALGVWWIQRLCSSPQGDAQRSWQARVDALAAHFGLRRRITLRLVDSLATPASVGWWRPVVLLPTALLTRMPVDLIEALLAHELAHIRRHDYLVNLLQGAVEAMLFYHPVTWWLSRQIRIEREHIADRMAVEVAVEPRRLAFALSELSGCMASASPMPSLALAANGGRLMSRIEQLIRPGIRRSSGRIAFPLIGFATACLAFYAHAQINGKTAPAASPVAAVSPVSAVAPVASKLPVPAAAPGAVLAQAPVARTGNHMRMHDGHGGASFALVRKGAGYTMTGSSDDTDDIDAARSSINGDFVWFRKGDQAYVIDDPATVSRATAAWAETEKLGSRMEALGSQMEVHGKKMEALGRQMEQISAGDAESAAMKAAGARMEGLGRQQEQLASKQAKLALAMVDADDARREQLSHEMEQLSAQQETLGEQMEAQSRVMEAESERIEQRMQPMEALGRQMDEAGKPMEALGEQMDVLGEQMDSLSAQAERETLSLIDEAMAKGLAKPAPVRR
jgi:beta-lactamase regulating signal transducer with metallopeptidase domain